MNKILAVLNSEYCAVAFIKQVPGHLTIEMVQEEERTKLEQALEFLKTQLPKIFWNHYSQDGKTTMVVGEIDPAEPDYLSAVAQELEVQGILCYVIDEAVKEAVLSVSRPDLAPAERQGILADIFSMNETEAKVFMESLNMVRKAE